MVLVESFLYSGAPDQNVLNFMQLFGKFRKIVFWRPHWRVGAPPMEILDPPLIITPPRWVRNVNFYVHKETMAQFSTKYKIQYKINLNKSSIV